MVFSGSKILQAIDSEVQREQKANSDVYIWGLRACAGEQQHWQARWLPVSWLACSGSPGDSSGQTGRVPWLGTRKRSGYRATSSSLWGPGWGRDTAVAPGLCTHLCPSGLPGSRLSQWHSSGPYLVPCPALSSRGNAATRPSMGLELQTALHVATGHRVNGRARAGSATLVSWHPGPQTCARDQGRGAGAQAAVLTLWGLMSRWGDEGRAMEAAGSLHCRGALHTRPLSPWPSSMAPATQMRKLRLQEQVALVAWLVCHLRRNLGCPPHRGLGELGGCSPFHYIGSPQPLPYCSGETRHQRTGWPIGGGGHQRQGCVRLNCFVRQEVALCCFWQIRNTGFRLLGPELWLYRSLLSCLNSPGCLKWQAWSRLLL